MKRLRSLAGHVSLREFFRRWFSLSFSLFSPFLSFWKRKREKKKQRKDDNFFCFFFFFKGNDVLSSAGKRDAFMKLLGLSESFYDSARWCLPSPGQIVHVP